MPSMGPARGLQPHSWAADSNTGQGRCQRHWQRSPIGGPPAADED